jgi:ComF family protein
MRDFTASLFFGGSCFLCRGGSHAMLCAACAAELPRLPQARCPRCALPSPGAALCGRCLAEPPAYDATVAVLAYDFPADALVHALKFRGELALAALLGRLLKEHVMKEEVDHVIPVPLAAGRLRARGFNQAAEIARHILPSKLRVDWCERSGNSPPQMELPWAERQRNVRGVFRCERSFAGTAVAVVDDVMTTGATLNELARMLKRAGARSVANWVVARTLAPS